MMAADKQRFILAEDVVFRVINEQEAVLLRIEALSLYELNPTAALILRELERRRTRLQIIEALCEEFEIDAKGCEADLDAFLTELEQTGVCVRSENGGSADA